MFWKKRKPRNRRLGRVQVLDVKVRSSVAAAARTRMVAITFGIVFGTVFGLYVAWRIGEWALNELVYENRAFAIQQIDIQTDGVISPEELRRWCQVRPGQNLLALDLARVKRDLEMRSVVHSVSVERILPNTVRIRVAEREPVAQINVPRPKSDGTGIELKTFQVDSEGCVTLPLDPRQLAVAQGQNDNQLPVISGINVSEVQPGRRIDSAPMRAAMDFIEEFGSSPMAGLVSVSRIDLSSPQVLIVTTEQGSEITFAFDNMDQQLHRWQQVHQECLRYRKSIATLDLAVSKNTPLRLQEASLLPPPAPKTVKPQRTKRRNV